MPFCLSRGIIAFAKTRAGVFALSDGETKIFARVELPNYISRKNKSVRKSRDESARKRLEFYVKQNSMQIRRARTEHCDNFR